MEKMADPDSLAPMVPLVPLVSEETLLLSMKVEKLLMSLDHRAHLAHLALTDVMESQELRDKLDTPASPESLDRLATWVPPAPLDHLAKLERMVTTADLASPETEEPPAHRALVDSLEPLDFQE